MSVVLLPSGVIRIPTNCTLDDGTIVDGTRELAPEDSDYWQWRPYAVPEEIIRFGDPDDAELLARWRDAASA
ncbi:hypothetical protein [Nonomuraea jabiensis]|uniref:hypothetical protein n=1 Tax=Nonomuraea jabiensis TaxID=882448 RepID=UPI003D7534A3